MLMLECNKQFRFDFGRSELVGTERRVGGEILTKGKFTYFKFACFTICWMDNQSSKNLISILNDADSINTLLKMKHTAREAKLGSSTQLAVSEQQFKREIVEWLHENGSPFLADALLTICGRLAWVASSKVRADLEESNDTLKSRLENKRIQLNELRQEMRNLEASIVELSKSKGIANEKG